ncbi:hypothetical protein BDW60DRAFT_172877 [Aspergillus nidulans var. acristatus]
MSLYNEIGYHIGHHRQWQSIRRICLTDILIKASNLSPSSWRNWLARLTVRRDP